MAIEKSVIEQGLTERGLESTLANAFSFETEEMMNSTLDQLKPRTFETIEDVLKDEKLSVMVRTYRDKQTAALQSKIDKMKKQDKDDEPNDFTAALEEAMKPIKEKLAEFEAKGKKESLDSIVTKLTKEAGIVDQELIDDIKDGLTSETTEAQVKEKIEKKKKLLVKMGIKGFGTPSGGGGEGGGDFADAVGKWKDKNSSKKQ